ncbi:MAG: methyltransferase domain-containing protein [Cyanobacteria bacterium J06573_11]
MPLDNDSIASPLDAPDAISGVPFLHTTPAEALGASIHKSVPVGDKTFRIAYPGDADKLLDHPSTHEAFEADDYIPYWAELWPASVMLAKALISQSWPNNHTALEIGCGVGLPGIVALSLGMRVIFSDYDATAVDFAARNAMANGFDNFETQTLDWRVPPSFRVPLILAADVIYEERNIPPLIAFIKAVLAPGGVCLLSDPDRSTRGGFRYALKQAKLSFTKQAITAAGHENRVVTGSVYSIRQPGKKAK